MTTHSCRKGVAACALLAVSIGSLYGKELTPELLASTREVGDFAISPDGARVAFALKTAREDGEVADLWLVSVDGTRDERPIAASDGDDYAPQWAPDNRTLAFLSTRGESGDAQIHLKKPDDATATKVTSAEGGVKSFAWSPDGSGIAFTAAGPTDREGYPAGRGLWLWHVDEREARPLTSDAPEVVDLAWSPDGRKIAVNSGNDLLVIASDSGDLVRKLHRNVSKPWSRRQIFDWSPDGQRILFAELASEDISPAGIGFWMAIVPAGGGEAKPLLRDYRGTITRAVWAADSRHVIAQSFEGTASKILRIDSETGGIAVLVDEILDEKSFVVSADNERIVYTSASVEEPVDLWAYHTGSGKRRLTRLNPQFAGIAPGAVSEVTWVGEDGRTLYGVLVTPPGYEAGRRLPTIVQLHGGPHFAWWRGWLGSWHDWAQLLAQSGYAVFLPNPRGSTGQGLEFSLANVNDIASGPLADVLAGVQRLIDDGVADPDRLGIGGWSYGGYLTAWTITQTGIFDAAVVGAGISRVTSRSPMLLKEYFGNIDVRGRYRQLVRVSPEHFLHRVHTPTLVIHGEEDQKIDRRQAIELYDGLQEMDVDSELVLYPGEGHVINGKEHRIDMLRRVVDWYDRHVR